MLRKPLLSNDHCWVLRRLVTVECVPWYLLIKVELEGYHVYNIKLKLCWLYCIYRDNIEYRDNFLDDDRDMIFSISSNSTSNIVTQQNFVVESLKNLLKKIVQLAATCCFNSQQRNFVAWQCLRWVVIRATTLFNCCVASCRNLLFILLHLYFSRFCKLRKFSSAKI